MSLVSVLLKLVLHGEPAVGLQCFHLSDGYNDWSTVVVHTTSPGLWGTRASAPGMASSTGHYFQSPGSGGSAQYCVDPVGEVHCSPDNTICWGAPPLNLGGVHVELCAESTYSRAQWLTGDPWLVLLRGAARVAELLHRKGFPVVKRETGDLLAGRLTGYTGHVNVSEAWHQSDHTDPGENFPWDIFHGLVLAAKGRLAAPATPAAPGTISAPVSTVRPVVHAVYRVGFDVRGLQRAVHTTPDGQWGGMTDHAADLIRAGVPVFELQRLLGLTADGIAGPVTHAAHKQAVMAVQRALGVTADGSWGPATQDAYLRARFHNHA